MQLPFFYAKDADPGLKSLELDEDNSRHLVQVLRMKKGSPLHLTNGRGGLFVARVADDHKKHCRVEITSAQQHDLPPRRISLGLSLLKNTNRFEWFLEKATELGVTEIIPLICERTERQHFRKERMLGICVSALLQSQQVWLPQLRDPIAFEQLVAGEPVEPLQQRLIAHCAADDRKVALAGLAIQPSVMLLIGPEGDFSPTEIRLAEDKDFQPVSLGQHRLRTETAGVAAATILALSLLAQ